MNRFGPFSGDVEDVVDLVTSAGFLRGFAPNVSIPWPTRTIYEFDQDTIELCRECDLPGSCIVDWTWSDIKSKDAALLHRALVKNPQIKESAWPRVEDESNRLFVEVESHVESVLPYQEVQEIAGDLHYIMLERASGVTGTVAQHLFCVYESGGYPCGWRGKFPDGELIVYSRE